MLSKKPGKPEPPKDELSRRLQESLRKKRPRWVRLVVGLLLFAVGFLGLLAWLLYPPGPAPRLAVVAFDELGLAAGDREVTLRGRLEAPAGEERLSLKGLDVVFVDGRGLLRPGEEAKKSPAKSGPDGELSCSWTFPLDFVQGDFLLRLIGDRDRHGSEDRGRVFLLPAGTPLCLVQIDHTLTKDASWQKNNILDIAPLPGAADALTHLKAKGYQIVYLALGTDRPTGYQKMRGWIRHRSTEGPKPFPAGPVLGRFTLKASSELDTKPWEKTAARLTQLFPAGKVGHVAIAGTIEVAQQLHAAGLRTYYLGAGGDVPATVQRVASWTELRPLLEK